MNFMFIGSLFGFFCVVLGAFAAHGLKQNFSNYQIDIWQTAVFYQFIHALALVFVGLYQANKSTKALSIAGYSFVVGIFLFSGSLYLLALTQIKAFGMITPLGGALFLVGWGALALTARKLNN
jgi:uncharacterized membrane protein YgdD (TMEM256/DUF423 family)